MMMNFKNYFLIILVAVGLNSCYKKETTYYEDYDLTITYFDQAFDFSSIGYFAIRDSIGLLSDQIEQGDANWKKFYKTGGPSDQIRGKIISEMTSRGYSYTDSLKDADVIVNAVATITENSGYVYYPGYWYGYPGYWGGYWGWYYKYGYGYPGWGWGGYYPWYGGGAATYSYYSQNLMIEMADADSVRNIIDWINANPNGNWNDAPQMRYYWQAFIEGIMTSDNSYDLDRIITGIDEAFNQSEYLKK